MAESVLEKTLTVNPAFLQEIKDGNPELWQSLHRLRQLTTSADDPFRLSCRLVRALDELRERVAFQFSLEESYGYIEIPSTVATSELSRRIQTIRRQHFALFLQLSELCERAEEIQYRGAASYEIRSLLDAARQFDEDYRRHETLECELIEASFDLPCHR